MAGNIGKNMDDDQIVANEAMDYMAKEDKQMTNSSPAHSAIISGLRKELPPAFTRKYVCAHLGGLVTAKALANLDARNQGPREKVIFGKKIGYERDDFLDWLEKRLRNT